jgi:hypothetical protein
MPRYSLDSVVCAERVVGFPLVAVATTIAIPPKSPSENVTLSEPQNLYFIPASRKAFRIIPSATAWS